MIEHFIELRTRMINCVIVLGVVFAGCFYFAKPIYSLVTIPIIKYAIPNIKIITTQVTAPFMVPLQLSFLIAILICIPYIMYNIWMFVRPGLYKNERKHIAPIVVTSIILFYCGITFAMFVICPVALKFFTSCAPNNVDVMLDIGNYVDFIVTLAVATGIAFQIPIVTNLLIKTGILSKSQLNAKRKHVIVLTLILGMLLAPPDVISQLLLAIPMWGLFELGLVMSK